ncbi:ankyrin repeat domain-containing protein [Pedobacter sp. SYSU D00535]|uniref:ankyrin repeat domain-containing protein n=1 Tax=Pedobacter sp. SYSU D00535 TaxID=2810308 RepID=UPI001A95B51F|nr:ankyrin repeat domain-containing protein [Pedobacter sp. SYSU D00535]
MSTVELLEEYIQTGNNLALTNLLKTDPSLANCSTSFNISPLMLSCYYKKPEIASTLLSYIKDPNIHEAAAVGKFDSVANIIYHYPQSINAFSSDGFTPLGLASYFGNEEVARYLLLKGADPNISSQNGFRVFPLHSSVAANYTGITKILLEAGAEVNVSQASGLTPLHSAAHLGNIEVLILLLEAGANITAKTDDGKSPSDMAQAAGHTDIASILAY